MKYIQKKSPPQSFQIYKKRPNVTYSTFHRCKKIYKETRQSLLEEQGFICCYCGRRIENNEKTQIEHFYPKGNKYYKALQLDYETNMLACCDGGKQDRPQDSILRSELFCEAVKGDNIIPVNPLTKECEDKFLFDEDGTVLGVSADAEVTINMLNLNSPIILNKRKAAIKYYKDYPVSDWQKEYDKLSQKDSQGKFEEFCFVLQKYIEIFHSKELKI